MNNKTLLLMLIFPALLTACSKLLMHSNDSGETIEVIEPTLPTPTCSSENECKIVWSAARRWIVDTSRTKIQTMTNDFIETYNSLGRNSTSPTFRVTKEPQFDGSYKIELETMCGGWFCVPSKDEAVKEFNKFVTEQKDLYNSRRKPDAKP